MPRISFRRYWAAVAATVVAGAIVATPTAAHAMPDAAPHFTKSSTWHGSGYTHNFYSDKQLKVAVDNAINENPNGFTRGMDAPAQWAHTTWDPAISNQPFSKEKSWFRVYREFKNGNLSHGNPVLLQIQEKENNSFFMGHKDANTHYRLLQRIAKPGFWGGTKYRVTVQDFELNTKSGQLVPVANSGPRKIGFWEGRKLTEQLNPSVKVADLGLLKEFTPGNVL